jgi:hypothetical protein
MDGRPGGIKTAYEGHTFDSAYECRVYQHLRVLTPWVRLQQSVPINPVTPHFPAAYWHVDFYLPVENIYVEAKGVVTSMWLHQLRELDVFFPHVLDRLIVVHECKGTTNRPSQRRICKGLMTVPLKQLGSALEAKKEFLRAKSST